MKRLLQINTTLNFGSTGRIVENIGLLANTKGFETYVIHGPRFVNSSQLKNFCTEGKFEEKLHGLKSLLGDAHGLGSKRATLRTIEFIDQIKPDIIHLHNIHGYYINYPILFNYLKKINVPVVWTFHDCWSFTGHCAHFHIVGCYKWEKECNNCPIIGSYPKSFLDFSKRNFNLKKDSFTGIDNLIIVSVSDWLKGLIQRSFLKDYKINRIYNGINTRVFYPRNDASKIRRKYRLEDKFIILGVASPWSEGKGFGDFLQLSNFLSQDEIIILVGLDKQQIKSLPSNIIPIERTNSVDFLADLYSTADLFFNPSKQETFGLTTAEALACGTPALVYNVTACPEIVDTLSGFVIKEGDINGVLRVVSEVKLRGKNFFKKHCLQRIQEKFKDEDCYNKYIELYDKLLNK